MKAREILGRIRQVLNVRTLAQIAESLDVSASVVSRSVRLKRLPEAWLYKVAYQTGVRIEWLRTGEGPRLLSEAVAEERAIYHLDRKAVLPLLERIEGLDPEERESVELFLKLLTTKNERLRTHLMNQLGLLALIPPAPKKRALP